MGGWADGLVVDRRGWILSTAFAAAAVGLPRPWFERTLAEGVGRKRPFLDQALEAARWIDRNGQQAEGGGTRWPADPLKPESGGLDFYNGMPGVVLFFATLHAASGDRQWLSKATSGADHLIGQLGLGPDQLDNGLYTGLGGLGYTLMTVAKAGGGAKYAAAARRTAELIRQRGVVDDSNDIISGTAGTGLFLLWAAREWKDRSRLGLAVKAGERLLATGQPAEGGLMWFPGAALPRNYPNFSHGTGGVAYFLATLHRDSGDRRFLDAAIQGARYLDAVATRRDGAITIFHQSGGGENRYYLSWCHGPVGTARLFYRLYQTTGEQRWSDWVDGLTRGVLAAGVPEQRTEGFWNNISQCCGNTGIGQYTIDLARYRPTAALADLRARIVADNLRRATRDDNGLWWVQAENRSQPANLVAQTGFMQGAAGVGTFLLQLDAFDTGRRWLFPQPDTPFAW